MGNKKISALGTTTLTATDDFVVEKSNSNYRVPMAQISAYVEAVIGVAAYGLLYCYDQTTAQTGIGTGFTKVTGFTNVADELNINGSPANDRQTVGVAGKYDLDFQASFSGTLNTTFTFAVFVNQIEWGTIGLERKLGTGGDVGSASMTGILDLAVDDEVEIFVKADGATKSMTPHYMQLQLHRIL